MTSSSEGLTEFFRTILGKNEGWAYLPTKGPDGEKDWEPKFYQWPQQEALIVAATLRDSARKREVYFSPALYKRRIPKKEYVLGAQSLWADFDGNAPANWEPSDAPSVRVISSLADRQHCYWVLDEFLTDIDILENRNRTIAIRAQADTSGWDATQLLRPPYTTNYGYDKPDRRGKTYDVTLDELSDKSWPILTFAETKDFRPLIADSLGEIPDVNDVLTELTWPKEFLPLFRKEADELTPKDGQRGKRSDALARLAYIVAEANGTDAQIYSIVSDANERWKKYPATRTDRHKRLVDYVERARAKHPTGDNPSFSALLSIEPKVAVRQVWDYSAFINASITINWFMEGLMTVGGMGFIFGPPGVGKTQIGIRMAYDLAMGKDFLTWKNLVGHPVKVLFLSLEMNHSSLKYFMDIMDKDFTDQDRNTLSENMFIFPQGEDMPVDTPEGKKWLEALLDEVKPEVLFIDSLSKITMKDLNDNIGARELINYLDKLRAKYSLSIYVVHHDNKGKSREHYVQDDMYGSRFLPAGADFVLAVSKVNMGDPDVLKITCAKIRMGIATSEFAVSRTSTLNFKVEDIDEVQSVGKGGLGEIASGLFSGLPRSASN